MTALDIEMAVLDRAMSEADYDRLDDLLGRLLGGSAMNLELVDGFFAALICGPSAVPPSEYLPVVMGGAISDQPALSSPAELESFLHLLMRHWNTIARTLSAGEPYMPLLLEYEKGVAIANDWAQGFLRAIGMRLSEWSDFIDDEDCVGALVPIFALANEHHAGPTMCPYPDGMTAEQRETLIVGVVSGLNSIYRYFLVKRNGTTYRRQEPKVGRNDRCPHGSGKKFKMCCGKVSVH